MLLSERVGLNFIFLYMFWCCGGLFLGVICEGGIGWREVLIFLKIVFGLKGLVCFLIFIVELWLKFWVFICCWFLVRILWVCLSLGFVNCGCVFVGFGWWLFGFWVVCLGFWVVVLFVNWRFIEGLVLFIWWEFRFRLFVGWLKKLKLVFVSLFFLNIFLFKLLYICLFVNLVVVGLGFDFWLFYLILKLFVIEIFCCIFIFILIIIFWGGRFVGLIVVLLNKGIIFGWRILFGGVGYMMFVVVRVGFVLFGCWGFIGEWLLSWIFFLFILVFLWRSVVFCFFFFCDIFFFCLDNFWY